MNAFQVAQLSRVALQYNFLKYVEGFEIIGPEEGPFAFYFPEMGALCVVGGNKDNVEHVDLYEKDRAAVLSLCKNEGTSLQVVDDIVQCTVGTTTGVGESYTEALMRAYVAQYAKDSD